MKAIFFSFFLFAATGLVCGQDIEVTTKDGRIVVLKPDGTWQFKIAKPVEEVKKTDQPTQNTAVINSLATFDNKLPFDDFNASKIPARFSGHSVPEMISILARRFADKDEFETTATYASRIASAKSQGIYEKLPLDSTLVVMPTYAFTEAAYDADKAKMSIELRFDYTADLRRVRLRNTPERLATAFDIDAVAAKDLKANLEALYLIKLREPFFEKGAGLLSDGDYLIADLLEVWYFNKSTGKVEQKVKNTGPK